MLNWHFENGKWLGFDDDTLMYIVDYDAEEGWRWLDVFEGWAFTAMKILKKPKPMPKQSLGNFQTKWDLMSPFTRWKKLKYCWQGNNPCHF